MSRFRVFLLSMTALAALALAPAAHAAPGALDPTFGSGGSVRLLPSEEKISLRAVAVQPDSKIVLAGGEFATQGVLLVRLLPNGELDPGFGQGGMVSTPFPGGFGEARAVALQPDGRIVVAGAAKGLLSTDFLVARYNGDGSPDAGFGGGDGIQILPIGPAADSAQAVAFGAGGNILVTGRAELGGSKTGAAVAVLKPDGEPDATFSGDGRTIVDTTADDSDEGVAIVEVAFGSILIGDATGNGAGNGFTLVQLLPTGLPDSGFGGGDGVVNTPIPGAPTAKGRVTDLARRPEGRIVASGYGFENVGTPPAPESKFAAVGYLSNGELDPLFGAAGIFAYDVNSGADSAEVAELTPEGKVVLAGAYDPEPSKQSTALVRLEPGGTLDPTFGSGGQVLRGLNAPFGNIFQDAALDPEERLVTVSTAYLGGGNTVIEVSRYLGDREPPPPTTAAGQGDGGRTPATVLNKPAHAEIKPVRRKVPAAKLKGFAGTATDPDTDGVSKVEIAVVKKIHGIALPGARDARRARPTRCFALTSPKPIFKRVKAVEGQCPQRWLRVRGSVRWSFKLKGQLPPGRYTVFARATDARGLTETAFSRALRNRYAFRVLPPS